MAQCHISHGAWRSATHSTSQGESTPLEISRFAADQCIHCVTESFFAKTLFDGNAKLREGEGKGKGQLIGPMLYLFLFKSITTILMDVFEIGSMQPTRATQQGLQLQLQRASRSQLTTPQGALAKDEGPPCGRLCCRTSLRSKKRKIHWHC